MALTRFVQRSTSENSSRTLELAHILFYIINGSTAFNIPMLNVDFFLEISFWATI